MPLSESANARALRELRGKVCPACGKNKGTGKSFCSTCYYLLPQENRNALYRLFGDGYLEAYDAAIEFLKAE